MIKKVNPKRATDVFRCIKFRFVEPERQTDNTSIRRGNELEGNSTVGVGDNLLSGGGGVNEKKKNSKLLEIFFLLLIVGKKISCLQGKLHFCYVFFFRNKYFGS